MIIQLFATMFEEAAENIGIGRITAFLTKNNKEVVTTYFNKKDTIEEGFEKVDLNCKIYGFSMYNSNVTFFIPIINKIKKINPDAIVFVGSKYATTYYEDILENAEFQDVDFVVLGDGEYSILNLVQCIEDGEDINEFVKNHPNIAAKAYVTDKVPAALDINMLPYPDRTWLKENKYIGAYICDCHGCTGKCSFCAFANYHRKWNGRSASDLYDEILEVHNECHINYFIFTGGSFEDPGELGKKKIEELCNLLSEIPNKFTFKYFLRADTFKETEKDIRLLNLMKKSGFNVPLVGIESGNDEDLKLYNKKATVKDNLLTLKLLNDADIYTGGFGFIMFNPYSDFNRLKANYEFLSQNGASYIRMYTSKLFLNKNTSIYHKISADGLLDNNEVFYKDTGLSYRFVNKDVSELWEFINDHLCTEQVSAMNKITEDILIIVYGFYGLLNNGIDYRNEIDKILYKNQLVLKEYFYHLYVNIDLVYCKKMLNEFINELLSNNHELILLKNRLMKELFKNNILS